MKNQQIDMVNTLADENVLTLNGIVAHAHPVDEGVLIENNPFLGEEDKWDNLVVSYPMFIETVRNYDGRFQT